MRSRLVVLFAAASAAFAWVDGSNAQLRVPEPVDQIVVDAVLADLADATRRLADNDIAGADRRFDTALASPGFEVLASDQRYESLVRAGIAALEVDAARKAHALLVRACELEEAEGIAWHLRLRAAYSLKDYVDSARSITVIARRWPAGLDQIREQAIFDVSHRIDLSGADSDARITMLSALFDANWTNEGQEPNELWFDYVRYLLAKSDMSHATEVAARMDSPEFVLSFRIDKRFDALVRARKGGFDIGRTMQRQRERLQQLRERHPDRLSHIVAELVMDVRDGHAERALEMADRVIARVTTEGATAYADTADHYVWILDSRAQALQRLGRWDEAVTQLRKAARRPENGGMNVSQTLNLARLLARLERNDEVEDAMEELGVMSPYGRMQLALNRLIVADAQGNTAAVTTQLDAMRAERSESMGGYQVALVLAGRIDAAAALLIERLRGEDWRRDALSEVQTYTDVAQTPRDKAHMVHLRQILARKDVQEALEAVGRTERVPFANPFF